MFRSEQMEWNFDMIYGFCAVPGDPGADLLCRAFRIETERSIGNTCPHSAVIQETRVDLPEAALTGKLKTALQTVAVPEAFFTVLKVNVVGNLGLDYKFLVRPKQADLGTAVRWSLPDAVGLPGVSVS